MRIARLSKLISHLNLRQLIVIASGTLLLLALPWTEVWRLVLPETMLGLEGGFLASLFIVPCLIGFVLHIYSKYADDLERHMRKFENE